MNPIKNQSFVCSVVEFPYSLVLR